MIRPLSLASTNSETSVEATGSSPPRPIPAKKRKIQRMVKVVAKAESPLANENKRTVRSNTHLRPYRSAIIPAKTAPTAIPIELMLPSHPACSGDKCHDWTKSAMIKEMIPTSIASNNQANPTVKSNFR